MSPNDVRPKSGLNFSIRQSLSDGRYVDGRRNFVVLERDNEVGDGGKASSVHSTGRLSISQHHRSKGSLNSPEYSVFPTLVEASVLCSVRA
jgi:hypothetical protein